MEKLSVDLIKKTISEARIPIASYAKTGMVKHLYADLYPEENGRVFKVMYKVDWNGRFSPSRRAGGSGCAGNAVGRGARALRGQPARG